MKQSYEAEENLLGMAMIDSTCAIKLLEIPESWFLRNANKIIYREINALVSESLAVNSIALADNILGTSELKHGIDMPYLVQLECSTTSLRHFDSYKKSLFSTYKKIGVEQVGKTIIQKLESGEDVAGIIHYMQEEVFSLLTGHNDKKPESIKFYLNELTKQMKHRMENPDIAIGLQTGYEDLDKTIGGFEGGKIYIIAARPSMGKSAFGFVDVGLRISQDTKEVVVGFSLEMKGSALAARAVCNQSGLHGDKIKLADMTSDEWTRFAEVCQVMSERNNLYIDERTNLSTAQIRASLKAIELKHGKIGAVIIDHIGQIKKNERKDDTQAMNQIANELLGMAKDFDCAMIELAQLSRALELRPDKRPILSDIKQSSALEENADVVMFIYRDEYYNADTQSPNVTELIIAKNREGENKTLYFNTVLFCSQYTPILNYIKPEVKQKTRGKFK